MKNKQRLFLMSTILVLSGTRGEAATYTVNASGGGNYSSISACATVAKPGDTCIVYAGTYGGWTQPTSGVAGNPITFQANPGDSVLINSSISLSGVNYITIGGVASNAGFQITGQISLSSTAHITIQNNNINHTSGRCIQGSMTVSNYSSYVSVLNDTITYCGSAAAQGIFAGGDHWLIDGNNISHVEDGIAIYGPFNVVRNNHFGPVIASEYGTAHPDALESSCAGDLPLQHMLFEKNVVQDWGASNAHMLLLRDTNSCGQTTNVIRYNTAINIGTYWISNDTNSLNELIYNNSVSYTEISMATKDFTDLSFTSGDTGANLINNILTNMTRIGSSDYCYYVDASSLSGFYGNYNLCYLAGWTGSWQKPNSALGYGTKDRFNQDPLFVNSTSDLSLRAGSPAIGAGGPLTTVASSDSGSGASLVVTNAGFFQDGYGISGVQSDWIRIGSTANVQISSINYSTNTITLASSVSRSVGDPVYLYKDSNGRVVLNGTNPDIGAYQTGSQAQTQPIPPTNLQAIVN